LVFARLGRPPVAVTPKTVIVVLTLDTAAGPRDCAIVVSDVVSIGADAVPKPPTLRSTQSSDAIEHFANSKIAMLVLLNVDTLLVGEIGSTMTAQDSDQDNQ
jgi:chemotaxis signal transduction protein